MTRIGKEEKIYSEIGVCFANFQKLARISLQRHWKSMGRAERYAAMRGFVRFADLVDNPGKYFSRATTESAWRARVDEYVTKQRLLPHESFNAYYIVRDPKGCVMDMVGDAFRGAHELCRMFYCFCESVQKWEYNRTLRTGLANANAERHEQDIMKIANQIKVLADINLANPLVRPIKQFLYELQK